ncbi:hypothetical protein FRC03_001249 [Tulasnella sp. 419]|nr:hypothetical protein FRC02_007380 [Tulasnella sp. 418]KAG8964862.1 hypothetical protein FRC03_001249 [Tulasnella sp. 419]
MARRTPQASSRAAAPAYLAPRSQVDPNESAFSRFLRTEVFAPEKKSGNISILVGVSMFAGAVAFARTWGDALVLA